MVAVVVDFPMWRVLRGDLEEAVVPPVLVVSDPFHLEHKVHILVMEQPMDMEMMVVVGGGNLDPMSMVEVVVELEQLVEMLTHLLGQPQGPIVVARVENIPYMLDQLNQLSLLEEAVVEDIIMAQPQVMVV